MEFEECLKSYSCRLFTPGMRLKGITIDSYTPISVESKFSDTGVVVSKIIATEASENNSDIWFAVFSNDGLYMVVNSKFVISVELLEG